ncbi:MAG: hypothetical protein WA051_02140 [Minisyncoccia bacterium]
MNNNVSPLDSSYNRLDEAHRAWHLALMGYHNISDFRAGINSAIQALRNITFMLQNQKNNLQNFDSWYMGWQTKMRNNPILKELLQARNTIVKQEDLLLHSTAIAKTKGWINFQETKFTFNPINNSYEVAKGFYDNYAKCFPVENIVKNRLIFEFERKWVYEKLPEYELLEAIAQAYGFFIEMLRDASRNFSLPTVSKPSGNYCSGDLNNKGKLRCMTLTPHERCLIFSFETGKVINMKTYSISKNLDDLKVAGERYGHELNSTDALSLLDGVFSDEYPFNQVKIFSRAAIANLKTDKHLVPVSFIFFDKTKPPFIMGLQFQNQEQKIISIDKLAMEILKNNGSFVLTMAETWVFKSQEDFLKQYKKEEKDAESMLQISCITKDELKIISIPFRKGLFGKIIFSKPDVNDYSTDEDHPFYIFRPIIKALKEVIKQ